jgi:hypothetical protein
VKYLAAFLDARNSTDPLDGHPTKPTKLPRESAPDFCGYPTESPYKTYETPPDAGSVGSVGSSPREFAGIQGVEGLEQFEAAAWIARRPPEIARWPISRREAWGRRANELEEGGTKFPLSEIQAYCEIRAAMGQKET